MGVQVYPFRRNSSYNRRSEDSLGNEAMEYSLGELRIKAKSWSPQTAHIREQKMGLSLRQWIGSQESGVHVLALPPILCRWASHIISVPPFPVCKMGAALPCLRGWCKDKFCRVSEMLSHYSDGGVMVPRGNQRSSVLWYRAGSHHYSAPPTPAPAVDLHACLCCCAWSPWRMGLGAGGHVHNWTACWSFHCHLARIGQYWAAFITGAIVLTSVELRRGKNEAHELSCMLRMR